MFLKEVSYNRQGSIYVIKYTVKTLILLNITTNKSNGFIFEYTVSHIIEYTPHIFVNILLYLFMWQNWRNDTLLQCKVVSVQLV